MIVVSDTSPISNLTDLGCLDILRSLFREVIIPEEVYREISRNEDPVFLGIIKNAITEGWIHVQQPSPILVPELDEMGDLDAGETEAIRLAIECEADLLLIDERAGTRVAHTFHLKTVGLLGVLLQAKEFGLIDHIRPLLDTLREDIGFWIADALYQKVLSLAGE